MQMVLLCFVFRLIQWWLILPVSQGSSWIWDQPLREHLVSLAEPIQRVIPYPPRITSLVLVAPVLARQPLTRLLPPKGS